jgi:hypothetical protein
VKRITGLLSTERETSSKSYYALLYLVWSVGFGSVLIQPLFGCCEPLGGIVELAPRYLKYNLGPCKVRKDIRRGEMKNGNKTQGQDAS